MDAKPAAVIRTRKLGVLEPCARPPVLAEAGIRHAIENTIWPDTRPHAASEFVKPDERICLVVSDHTRKLCADRFLPVLLEQFRNRGCDPADFFILIASGVHRHPTAKELAHILGMNTFRLFRNRIFCHDPDDKRGLVSVGATSRGHKVQINRRAVEADRLILIGAATYHYHAGFSGGRKSLVPGLAARATIQHNHSLTLDPDRDRIHPDVGIGKLDGNPVSEEMYEAASLCMPDLIVNSVVSPDGQLAGLFAGHLDLAHRAACALAEKIQRVDIPELADFVIASAGTARDWIQSHKALYNASRAVTDQGWIILEAPCPEGLGNESFRRWVRQREPERIYRGLRENPEILGQTALSSVLRGRRTLLITRMPRQDSSDLGIETAPNTAAAVAALLSRCTPNKGRRLSYYDMPHARYVVPFAHPPNT